VETTRKYYQIFEEVENISFNLLLPKELKEKILSNRDEDERD